MPAEPFDVPFRELNIVGVFLAVVVRYRDERGWLVETVRDDWLEGSPPESARPVMSYISLTRPGVVRGPHEHVDQTDYFAFLGPGSFRIHLWDNRADSNSHGVRLDLTLGEEHPALLIVPPGVVHAYRNISGVDGLVVNHPNRLFAGRHKSEPVDEIRHEDDPNSPFEV